MTDGSSNSGLKASKAERQEATNAINQMQESGEYKRLQEKLLTKILTDNPEYWDAMRIRTREVIQGKDEGVLAITMDELSAELLQTGKAAVPGELKQKFVADIQDSMERLAKRKR